MRRVFQIRPVVRSSTRTGVGRENTPIRRKHVAVKEHDQDCGFLFDTLHYHLFSRFHRLLVPPGAPSHAVGATVLVARGQRIPGRVCECVALFGVVGAIGHELR
jgi:hypothetical protein